MKGDRIGAGGTSEVFRWGEDRVLKLFREEYTYAVAMEAARARAVHEAGLAVPEVFGEVEVDGRSGIVFERIEGPLLLARLRDGPDAATPVGRLLAEIHAHQAPGLPPVRDVLVSGIERVGEDEREVHRARAARVLEGAAVIHGDLHPGNVIMSARGPVVIDWVNGFSGPPALDVARSCVLMRFGAITRPASDRELAIRKALVASYLERIVELGTSSREEVECCKPICAAAMARELPDHPERDALLALARVEVPGER